jgi:hypothetical protein
VVFFARPILFLLLVAFSPARAAEITVQARRSGDVLQVEASAEFEGEVARTWRVLTDYGRLAEFIPDLRSSRIISRDGNSAIVEQKGEARLLFFSYPIDLRLAVTEFPREKVVSRAIAGNFKEMRGTYTLQVLGDRLQLRYSGLLEPSFAVPPLIGTLLLRHNVETSFRALVEEIERQHAQPQKQ